MIRLYTSYIILFVRMYARSVASLRIANFRGKSTHLMWEESKHWLQFLCISVPRTVYMYCCWWNFLFVCFFFDCIVLIVSSQRHTRFRNILGLGTRSYAVSRLLLLLYVCMCVYVYTSSSATFFVPLFLILPPLACNANKLTKRERIAHIFKVVATMKCVDKYIV